MSGSGDVEQSTAGGFLYAENDTCPSAPTTIRTKADAASSTSIASRGVEGNSTNSTCEYRPATFRTESHASKAETGTTAIGEGHEGGNGGSEGRWKSHIDTCTVDQLYPWRNTYGVTSRGEQVKAGFLKQEVRGRRYRNPLRTCRFQCCTRTALVATDEGKIQNKNDVNVPIFVMLRLLKYSGVSSVEQAERNA